MVKVTIGQISSASARTPPAETSGRSWLLPALCVLAVLAPFNLNAPVGSGRLAVALRPLLLLQLAITLAVVAVGLVDARRSRQPLIPRPLAYTAGALVVMVAISAALSSDRLIGAGGAVTAVALATTVVATVVAVRTPADGADLLRWFVIGTAVAAVIGVVVLLTGQRDGLAGIFVGEVTRLGLRPRLTRPWGHANVAAMALGPALVVVGVGALSSLATEGPAGRRRPSLRRGAVIGASLVLLAAALILTYSRAGVAAALAGAAVGAAALVRAGRMGPLVAAGVGGFLVVLGAIAISTPEWQGRFGSGSSGDFRAEITAPATVELGNNGRIRPVTAAVTVTNRSGRTWPAAGPERVALTARWLVAGTDQVADEQRWPLPRDIGPDRSATIAAEIDPTMADGTYVVLWDLLIDREAYFLQFSGRSVTSAATVTGSPVEPGPTVALVDPRVALDRPALWALAGEAFAENPLFGVGPMQLPAFAEPRLAETERFPGTDAHNTVLEALATWGILGTVALLWLILGGLWRLVRLVGPASPHPVWSRAGQRIGLVTLCGLVTICLHAMFEWPINEVSVAIPLGLLLGIGWSPFGTAGLT